MSSASCWAVHSEFSAAMDTARHYPHNNPPGTEQGDDTVETVVGLVILHQNNLFLTHYDCIVDSKT